MVGQITPALSGVMPGCSRPSTMSMKVTFRMATWRHSRPRRVMCRAGFGVARVSCWWSVCRGRLGEGGAGGGFIGDGLAGGIGGEQGGGGEPVDRAGQATGLGVGGGAGVLAVVG